MARVLVPVNPEMLIWARERAGYAGIDVPGFPEAKLSLWEAGDKEPTLTQAKTLAERYHRSLAFFFLRNPPEEGELPDFRGAADRKKTPALQAFVHLVEARCEWAEEVRREAGENPVGQELIGSGELQLGTEQASARILNALSIDIESIWSSPSIEAALDMWIQKIEAFGIFVFQNDTVRGKAIDCRQFRGLAIANPYAPAIGLNKQDAPRGKIFTLAHELTHLWIGQGGISTMAPNARGELNRIERFCNSTAAEMLMPKDIFQRIWEELKAKTNDPKRIVRQISKKMKVSEDAAARRALDCRYITREEYSQLHQYYLAEWEKWRERLRQGGGGGKKGNREQALAKQAGALFSRIVIAEYQAKDVHPTIARKLLNAATFNQIDEIARLPGLSA